MLPYRIAFSRDRIPEQKISKQSDNRSADAKILNLVVCFVSSPRRNYAPLGHYSHLPIWSAFGP